jgi:gluconolactonase
MEPDAMKLESGLKVVADGLGFPEGPVVGRDGTLYFVDIAQEQVMKLEPGAKKAVSVAHIPGGPNGMAIAKNGKAYVCNNGGIFDFQKIYPDPKKTGSENRSDYLLVPVSNCPGSRYGAHYQKKPTTGSPDPQADKQAEPQWKPGDPIPDPAAGSIWEVDLKEGKAKELFGPTTGDRLIAPDDIVFDPFGPEGSFWFTDCGYQNDHVLRKGGVYAANLNGMHPVMMADIPSANGLGFSEDGNTLFVADTLYGRLWALTMDEATLVKEPKGNKLFKSRVIKKNPISPFPGLAILALPGPQWLDSLKVQADGRVCVGTLLRGGISVVTPGSSDVDFLPVGPTGPDGKVIPDPFTSNLCFGGSDMRDVWITASATGKIYHGRWPTPGLPPAFHV